MISRVSAFRRVIIKLNCLCCSDAQQRDGGGESAYPADVMLIQTEVLLILLFCLLSAEVAGSLDSSV